MPLQDLLRRSTRHVSLRGEMTLPSGRLIPLSGSDIISLSISEGVSDGMLLGSCPAASMRLVLADPGGDFLFLGSKRGASIVTGGSVRLFLRVMDDVGVWHEAPLGFFYVTDMTGTENSVSCIVQGVDALGVLFDAVYTDALTYPCTMAQMAQHMALQAGMSVNTDFPSADLVISSPPDFEGFTVRRALSCLAAACASFVHVDRTGILRITPIRDPLSAEPYPIQAANALTRHYGDASFGPLAALRVTLYNAKRHAEDAVLLCTEDVGVRPDALVDLSCNPLFAYGAAHAQPLASAAFAQMKGYALRRASLRWQGDPSLQLGRCVQMTDKRGQITLTHVTRQTLSFDRGFTMTTECTVRNGSSGAGTVISPSGTVRAGSITGSLHGSMIIDGSLGVSALAARSITSEYISASAIDTVHLSASSVTADKIKSGEITTRHLAADSVTAEQLSASSVQAEHLSAAAVTAEKIGAGEIRAVHIAGKTITADQLAAGLITADSGLIAHSAIGTAQIADGSVTSAKIVSLNADVIDAGTLKADRLLLAGEGGVIYEINARSSGLSMTELEKDQYKTHLNGTVIVAKSLTAAQIAARTITANEILSGAITAHEIAAETITSGQIAAHSITVNRLASDVGASLDLSSNESINLMVGRLNAAYVQFAPPAQIKRGDLWINTGESLWSDLAKDAWQTVSEQPWGYYHNALPVTRVWNGSAWQTVSDQEALTAQQTRIRQTEAQLSLMATRTDLAGKVSRSEYEQDAASIKLRVQTVEENSGKAETVQNTAMTLDKTGFHLKTGGTFTVDSGNFDVDANGNVSMLNASVSGNLTNNGIAVLTAKNLVVSSTQPISPVPGMVWVKPVGSTAATFLYNNTTVQSFKAFETAHTLQNAGTAVSAGGSYTYNVRIPYKVTGNVNATRYLTMYVNGAAIFTDVALEKTAGSYVLELGGSLPAWLGNANSLSFTLNLHYMQGDDGTLHNVHRVDVGAIDLKLYAKSDAASGWSSTEVQVYNG